MQRDVDEEGVFAIPVAEAYADVAYEYRGVIEAPMDFRTIEEERIPAYLSIRELQQDLVLVFHNCITFNDSESPYYALAEYVCTTVMLFEWNL